MVDDKTQVAFEKSVSEGSNKMLADAKKITDNAGVTSETAHAVSSRP